jgi:hypothetical protein
MEDGREGPLDDHLRDAHQKGTRGFTEEYLDSMHKDLHERKREPEEELEHRHPDAQHAQHAQHTQSAQHAQHTQSAQHAQHTQSAQQAQSARNDGAAYRPDEQPTSGAMEMKQRENNKPRTSESTNGKHRDRYEQHSAQGMDQQGMDQQGMDPMRSREADEQLVSSVPGQRRNDSEELQGTAAGSSPSGNGAPNNKKNGKHRKNRH